MGGTRLATILVGLGLAGLGVAALSIGLPPAWSQAPAAGAADADAGAPAVATEDSDEAGNDDGGVALPPPPADPDRRDEWLRQQLDAAIKARPLLTPAAIGAVVVDATTGKTLWSHHPDRPLNLASVTKVLTSSAALHRLGPGFRWRTSVYADKLDPRTRIVEGNLYVRGRGDPTLTLADLADLTRRLRWQGIEQVEGDLVIDGTYFDAADEPPRFADQPKERAGYRAPFSAASLERNAVTVQVVADRVGLGLAKVTVEPNVPDYVKLMSADVVTVATGRTRIFVSTKVQRTHLELRVSGQILADDGVWWQRRRIDDPARMFGDAFRAALAQGGVKVRGKKQVRAQTPPTAILVAEHESAPLAVILRDMNKASDNFLAESVLKTLGAEALPPPLPGTQQRPATWADGLDAVHRYLTDVAGVPPGSFRIENGSGLYDSTAVTADAVARVLVAGWRDFRVGPDLTSALAHAGVDGTLRRRLGGDATRGRIRAKTGTLATVTSLAGYAGVDAGRPLVFVVLINNLPPAARADARSLQDAVAAAAVAYTDYTAVP
ncbi:MAG TPA: D-alanyl-D-alanine carboxypeptidase/D-alanyl-D-alanine-endopeptidase [Kofleriaceae bacterium]|nr:D-alanyl-D-alanine carboxypeptidase/D-alanyl-D-alanine-endopeptidase [Kofleriaceae bacterium]